MSWSFFVFCELDWEVIACLVDISGHCWPSLLFLFIICGNFVGFLFINRNTVFVLNISCISLFVSWGTNPVHMLPDHQFTIINSNSHSKGMSNMWQCPVKICLVQLKVIHYWTKWPVGIWAPPQWSMWVSCKLDAGSCNSHSFTVPNVHST